MVTCQQISKEILSGRDTSHAVVLTLRLLISLGMLYINNVVMAHYVSTASNRIFPNTVKGQGRVLAYGDPEASAELRYLSELTG